MGSYGNLPGWFADRRRLRANAVIAGVTLLSMWLLWVTPASVRIHGATLSGRTTALAASTRPNIVMIMTDDQDAASLSVMPNVRKLIGGQGTTFGNSFVSHPLCCPSRATYLTGQYPHNHGVTDNRLPDGGYYRLRGRETLPVWLTRAGYATAHIGKYLNRYGLRNRREIPPGWQEWYGSVDPSSYRMWGYILNENGKPRRYGKRTTENPKFYQTDIYAAKAVDYINRKAPADQPFFLSVSSLAPHQEVKKARKTNGDPRPAPRHQGKFAHRKLPRSPSFNEANVKDKPAFIRHRPRLTKATIRKVRKNYQARLESLLAVDEAVAKIVTALDQRGELDNTLVAFASDNGWLQGEHRVPAGKRLPYESSIRVPMAIRGPGFRRNVTNTAPVTNVDLAATFLDIADARPGIRIDGRSLLKEIPKNRALLLETGPKPSGNRWYAGIRTPRYLYVEHSTGDLELYDLKTDPHELHSRHANPAYTRISKDLARRLAQLRKCGGSSCG